MRRLVVGLSALVLSGCASVSAVNENGGIVENASTAGAALKNAETHCAKTGRTARAGAYDGLLGTMLFDCVPR